MPRAVVTRQRSVLGRPDLHQTICFVESYWISKQNFRALLKISVKVEKLSNFIVKICNGQSHASKYDNQRGKRIQGETALDKKEDKQSLSGAQQTSFEAALQRCRARRKCGH